jgi:hypothetical protein
MVSPRQKKMIIILTSAVVIAILLMVHWRGNAVREAIIYKEQMGAEKVP